jgi:hypothetical protein
MARLVPAIHVFAAVKTWMPGTSPGMTNVALIFRLPVDTRLKSGCAWHNKCAVARRVTFRKMEGR